jgi:hypothetical protein
MSPVVASPVPVEEIAPAAVPTDVSPELPRVVPGLRNALDRAGEPAVHRPMDLVPGGFGLTSIMAPAVTAGTAALLPAGAVLANRVTSQRVSDDSDAGGLPDPGDAPTLPSTTFASAASAASAAMTFALIMCLLALLGAPGILRRTSVPPAVWRPGPFLSLAQRPG